METIFSQPILPFIFATLMGLALFIYVILDGYDLGVGILIDSASWHEKDIMISSIGPFWDANETWLILAIGIVLSAFPEAHGVMLTHSYIPISTMLFGLIFRGIAFDFRAKVPYQKKWRWNLKFFWGSLIASLSQGYIFGSYLTGFDTSLSSTMFSFLMALTVCSTYCLIGACWLLIKTKGALQIKAAQWVRYHFINSCLGLICIALTIPALSDRIFMRWFTLSSFMIVWPIPLATGLLLFSLYRTLKKQPQPNDKLCWLPYVQVCLLFLISFISIAYSFTPYIVPEKLTIYETAAATNSLQVILYGVAVIFPLLIIYTSISHYVFRGKATQLTYY